MFHPLLFAFIFIAIPGSFLNYKALWAEGAETEDREDLPLDAPLKIEVLRRSKYCDGEELALRGSHVRMHVKGTVYKTGTIFLDTFDTGEPYTFQLGVGMVLPAWDQGMIGMCYGERRKLTAPAGLAYGDKGKGDVIHAGATLEYVVQLVDILHPEKEQQQQPMDEEGNPVIDLEKPADPEFEEFEEGSLPDGVEL